MKSRENFDVHGDIDSTFGSHDDVLKDLRPLYLANRFFAGISRGVSTSSGNSDEHGNKSHNWISTIPR